MEQKKTLWIIAASGVFLLVVIGAALLLNAPSASAPATASITTIEKTPVAVKIEEPVISPVETPSADNALDSNTLAFQKIEGAESVPTDQEAAPAAQTSQGAEAQDSAQIAAAPANTTIELNTKTSNNVTATSRAGQEALSNAGAKSNTSTIYTGNPGTSSASKTVAKAPASSSAPKKVAAAPAKKAPVLSSKYWVQAASFTSKKSADNARATLDDNKIPAEVFTYKDNKDKLFYRVRVGPYTTKSEAEYWKTRVCKIDLFKDTQSYVTEIKM